MIDLGTGNNNKINWAFNEKQELIDIIETVYRCACSRFCLRSCLLACAGAAATQQLFCRSAAAARSYAALSALQR
jgi:hypothetical protein